MAENTNTDNTGSTGRFKLPIPRAVLELHRFTNDGRASHPGIDRIRVTASEQVATNGHCLAQASFKLTPELGTWGGDTAFYIPGELAKNILVGAKRTDRFALECTLPGPMHLVRYVPDGTKYHLAASFPIPLTADRPGWPDHSQVMKTPTQETTKIGLDLGLLDLFRLYLKKAGNTSGRVVFSLAGENEPVTATITLESGLADVVFVAMPWRMK